MNYSRHMDTHTLTLPWKRLFNWDFLEKPAEKELELMIRGIFQTYLIAAFFYDRDSSLGKIKLPGTEKHITQGTNRLEKKFFPRFSHVNSKRLPKVTSPLPRKRTCSHDSGFDDFNVKFHFILPFFSLRVWSNSHQVISLWMITISTRARYLSSQDSDEQCPWSPTRPKTWRNIPWL
jgi:hypothetical protein